MGTQLPATKRGRATPTFAYVYCGQMVAHPSYCWALVLDKPGSVGSPLGPPSVPEENLSGLVKWVFYRLDVLHAIQSPVSKHWRANNALTLTQASALPHSLPDSWWKGCCFLYADSLMPVPHASIHTAQQCAFLQCAYSLLSFCSYTRQTGQDDLTWVVHYKHVTHLCNNRCWLTHFCWPTTLHYH